jgi:hypothetical protein
MKRGGALCSTSVSRKSEARRGPVLKPDLYTRKTKALQVTI